MVIVVSTLAVRFLKSKCGPELLSSIDRLTIGMGKGAAIGMYIYFALKIIGIAHDDNWSLLATPYGAWFLVELLGFVLLPRIVFTYGVKRKSVGIVRFGAFYAVLGILLNRLNMAIITFNWNLPTICTILFHPGRKCRLLWR